MDRLSKSDMLVLFLFMLFSVTFGRIQLADDNDTPDTIMEVFYSCECVIYYQCDEEGYIITDGVGLIESRFGENNDTTNTTVTKFPCSQESYFCCRRRDTSVPNLEMNSREPENTTETPKNHEKKKHKLECGHQKTIINVRIKNDESDESTAITGEFPWIAAIFKKDAHSNFRFHCAGSFIFPQVVLTATHCVRRLKVNDLKVVINGEVEMPQLGLNTSHERDVQEVITHPDYYAGALYNDIALLILKEPLNMNGTRANTVCLQKSIEHIDTSKCIAAGWGKGNKNLEGTIMQKVELPLVEHSACQKLLRSTRLGSYYELDNSFTCAGGEEGKDTCNGDGGGPLVCPTSKGRYFQVGIVSWGIGCGQKDVPGVYTNVLLFYNWITQKLTERDIDISS